MVWFSTNGEGVYFYKNNRLYNLNTDDGLADDYAYCFAQDEEGKIWIGTDLASCSTASLLLISHIHLRYNLNQQ